MPRAIQNSVRAFGELKSEYQSMRDSRFRRRRPGVSSMGGPADAHYASEGEFIKWREYVRAMDRDDFLIGPLVDRCVENQVQGGFAPEPQTGDPKLDKDLWQRWHA